MSVVNFPALPKSEAAVRWCDNHQNYGDHYTKDCAEKRPTNDRLLGEVALANENLIKAKKRYEKAVLAAGAHISHSVIARRIGVTETAIRLFIKRRKDKNL